MFRRITYSLPTVLLVNRLSLYDVTGAMVRTHDLVGFSEQASPHKRGFFLPAK